MWNGKAIDVFTARVLPVKVKAVIPGFNTDIEHNGTTYHVQTEDKGLNSPLILSLIYTGGAILASKRTPYEDLIASGLDEAILAERLERQHKLICAAIKAGRIDDLRRMSDKGFVPAERTAVSDAPKASLTGGKNSSSEPLSATVPPAAFVSGSASIESSPSLYATPAPTEIPNSAEPRADKVSIPLNVTKPISTPLTPPVALNQSSKPIEQKSPPEQKTFADTTFGTMTFDSKLMGTGPLSAVDLNALSLSLLDEQDLRAGELAVLCIRVGRGINGADPVADADVTVKILGTTFHPIIISQKTNQFGMTVARANLPKFAAGRAAILVRAEHDGKEVMLRRVIQRS